MDTFYQGEDKTISFTYTDSNDDAININTVDDILVMFIINGKVVARFTKVSDPNTEDLVIDDAANGIFSAKVTRAMSLDFPQGVMAVEILTKETVSGYPNDFHSIHIEKIYQVEPSNSIDYGN